MFGLPEQCLSHKQFFFHLFQPTVVDQEHQQKLNFYFFNFELFEDHEVSREDTKIKSIKLRKFVQNYSKLFKFVTKAC